MVTVGLRERKKARTRQLIADTAARLFAERGYERVAVSDVAREAEVAEQTLYNYFPTKEQLVTDRDEQIQDRLCDLIRSRPPGVTPAAAVRDFILEVVGGIRSSPPQQWRGELGYLAAISPTVHRLALELTDARLPRSQVPSVTPLPYHVLDELDGWLSASEPSGVLRSENRKRSRGQD